MAGEEIKTANFGGKLPSGFNHEASTGGHIGGRRKSADCYKAAAAENGGWVGVFGRLRRQFNVLLRHKHGRWLSTRLKPC